MVPLKPKLLGQKQKIRAIKHRHSAMSRCYTALRQFFYLKCLFNRENLMMKIQQRKFDEENCCRAEMACQSAAASLPGDLAPDWKTRIDCPRGVSQHNGGRIRDYL